MFFQWAQLTLISNFSDIHKENLCQNHHVIKGARILSTDKLFPKEIYLILISNIVNKPTSNIYFEKLFENTILNWSKIYLLPRLATIDTTLPSFQYKIFNNLLFLNKKLYNFGITNTALCSFCKTFEETPIHFFYDCIHIKSLWEKLQTKFQNDINLPSLTPQAAIIGLTNEANNIYKASKSFY